MEKDFFKDVETILFDFEGTLVDFQWNLIGAVRETVEMLRTSGFPIDRFQDFKYSTLMNETMKMAIERRQSPDEVKEKIGAIYDRYDEDALTRWTLRPNARHFLSALKTKGMKTGLVSNVGGKTLEKALLKLDLHPFFNVVVSRNDVQFMKPSGEGLGLVLSRLQVIKDKALYVGDSLDDIQAAKTTGVRVIIIMGNENSKEELLSAGPDQLIHHFNELLPSLTRVTTMPSEM
jgi:HAD superfamily hydrolase (TIGR01509 family)